jgi:hypothetical protein
MTTLLKALIAVQLGYLLGVASYVIWHYLSRPLPVMLKADMVALLVSYMGLALLALLEQRALEPQHQHFWWLWACLLLGDFGLLKVFMNRMVLIDQLHEDQHKQNP